MNNLELKHLSPYLPYDLQFKNCYNGEVLSMESLNKKGIEISKMGEETGYRWTVDFNNIKPILHPLTDLDKIFTVNSEEYNRMLITDYFINNNNVYNYTCQRIIENRLKTNTLKFLDAQTLFKFHFDVFGLIEKGLAIDINQVS